MLTRNCFAHRKMIRRRGGFTLLEMIMVIMIIAVIAGLVIPQLSMIGRSADMAASAKSQADLANNIGSYFVLQKRFPTGMDSLLVGDGAADPTGVYTPVDDADGNQASGLPDSGPHLDRDLVMVNLADTSSFSTLSGASYTGYARSFTRGGFEFLYDHDRTVINSNDSAKFTEARELDRDSSVWVAKLADAKDGDASTAASIGRLMPNGIVPSGAILVAVGIGPNNDMRSKTLTNSPIYPSCDGTYYGRYVAIFKVYESGERPTLVAVVDSYGRDPDYTQQQFNESLPNGSRRG